MINKNSFACELPDSSFILIFGAGGCAPVEGSVPLMDPFETVIYPDPNTISARVVDDAITISLDIEKEFTKVAA